VLLSDVDGMEITRRLRSGVFKMPILFLTARTGVDDRIAGLSVGADDYVTKPFSLGEVVARIRAILRRTIESPTADSRLRFEDLILDEDTHEVWRAGEPIKLTATEFNLLRYLMRHPRHVLS